MKDWKSMDLPSNREEASRVGSNRFFPGTECIHGHIAPHYTKYWGCCECKRIGKNKYRERNVERLRQQDREYARLNSAKRIEASKKWRQENPDKRSAQGSLYRATRRQAAPKWLTKDQRDEIQRIYALSQWMSSATGEDFDVDHIYPLSSDFMCGLHVPSNLIVLSASDNAKKSNTWWPGQLECQRGKGRSHKWWKALQ